MFGRSRLALVWWLMQEDASLNNVSTLREDRREMLQNLAEEEALWADCNANLKLIPTMRRAISFWNFLSC